MKIPGTVNRREDENVSTDSVHNEAAGRNDLLESLSYSKSPSGNPKRHKQPQEEDEDS